MIWQHFDWIVGFTTLISVELMIRRKWYAWVFSLLNQFVWLTFIIVKDEYGLLPLNILLFVQNTRGLRAALRHEEQIRNGKHRLPDTADPPGRQTTDAQ